MATTQRIRVGGGFKYVEVKDKNQREQQGAKLKVTYDPEITDRRTGGGDIDGRYARKTPRELKSNLRSTSKNNKEMTTTRLPHIDNKNRSMVSKATYSTSSYEIETESEKEDFGNEKDYYYSKEHDEFDHPFLVLREQTALNLKKTRGRPKKTSLERSAVYDANPILRYVDENVVGKDLVIETPCLDFIEDYIRTKVMPTYANTHSTTGHNARQTGKFREEARSIIKECVNASTDDVAIFTGSGATSGMHKIAWALRINMPKVAADTVIRIRLEPDTGQIDLNQLQEELQFWKEKRRLLLVCMSAASNVTGIITDVDAVARIAHQNGALAIFDYAAGGCCDIKSSQVTRETHTYVGNIEEREEGGTPAIIESIRAGIVFKLKEEIGVDVIHAREQELCNRAFAVWERNPNLYVMGSHTAERIPIFSFVVFNQETGRFVHHNFVSTLLSDLYGIQARGGCACAGPPGFSRINLSYFLDNETVDFVIEAVDTYTFDPHTGDWKNKSFSNTMATDVAFKPRMKSASLGLRESMPKDKRRLRWFITPHEAAVLLADKDETWLDRKPYDMPFDLPHLPNRFPIDDDDNDGYASSTEEEAIVPPASYRDKYKETKDTYRGRTDKFKERFEREKNTKNRERDNVVKNKQDKEHNERYKTKIDRHNDMNDRDRNTNKTVRARGQSESRVKGYSEQYHDQRGYNSDTDDSWGHNPDNSRRNQGGYTKINATKAKYKKYQDALNKSQNRSDSYRAKREEAFEKIETHRSRKSVESDDYLGATSRSLPERKERVQVETTRGYSDSEYQARASFNTMPRKRERAPLPKYKRQ
ncbi:hypothetical protein MAR_008262 [Mya arenaria]|uniref:Aminotransferase class V domain-containing protein n=1 Tax=Mya arenaria TaxID=6604 RepID=A0ABY7DXG5_MYAAR|nr:hypothetical protein MAR_008262 [Mya arenaria]